MAEASTKTIRLDVAEKRRDDTALELEYRVTNGSAEQIYLLPSAWVDAEWWTNLQLENLRTLLDHVKRTYNIDENRVVLSGVSDGGTGTYYFAMRDTTPFASFLPLNGAIMVLRNRSMLIDGELFPNNFVNKPFFIVNGGKDPLYPTARVGPYIELMKKGGVATTYLPQPNAVHNTAWWPELKGTYEAFVGMRTGQQDLHLHASFRRAA